MPESSEPSRLPITGYLDRFSARPGERLAAKVSAVDAESYEAALVRVVHGDANPAGPGIILEPVPDGALGQYPAREQTIRNGSFATVPADPSFRQNRLFIRVLVQPWLLDRPAVLLSCLDEAGTGWSIEIDGQVTALIHRTAAGERRVSTTKPLRRKEWYEIYAGYDTARGALIVGQRCLAPTMKGRLDDERKASGAIDPLQGVAPLTMAAFLDEADPRCFNGRLEAPALHDQWPVRADDRPADVLARWDFAIGTETQAIVDTGPRALHGRLHNLPTRAVRGAHWSGREMSWRAAPDDYAAIHFHEDDLYDAGWETDFAFEVPAQMPSGAYAVRLRSAAGEDLLPFYVLPPRGGPKADICFLASTFTYQVYGNHARGNCDDAWRERAEAWGAYPHNPDDYPLYGRSTYNMHPDGSGVAFSSRLRPLLTMRPGFMTFVDQRGSGLRHYPADTHLLYWLTQKGFSFDIVTDEDLDDEGYDLIRDYRVVLTGSHPEYHTSGTLDALKRHTETGGRLFYLGGNGFYWRIARSKNAPGMIELRRGEGGIRAWAAEPGEYYHQLDGAYGGLWRRNARYPQELAGVGFSAQGLFEGSYYRRTPASYEPEAQWIFDGIDDERLGDFGFSGGGAAGFELDRADFELGTPPDTVILARSEGHSGSFVVVPEELLSHIATLSGEKPADLIKGEIVLVRKPGGGMVFSVGSITFCGSLLHNQSDNNISRLLENAINGFLDRD